MFILPKHLQQIQHFKFSKLSTRGKEIRNNVPRCSLADDQRVCRPVRTHWIQENLVNVAIRRPCPVSDLRQHQRFVFRWIVRPWFVPPWIVRPWIAEMSGSPEARKGSLTTPSRVGRTKRLNSFQPRAVSQAAEGGFSGHLLPLSPAMNRAGRCVRECLSRTTPDGSLEAAAGAVLSLLTIIATVNVTTKLTISTARAIGEIRITGTTKHSS